MSKTICDDIRKEISQYSSKIANELGEHRIFRKLTKNVHLRFCSNRCYIDVYFNNGFYLFPNVIPNSKPLGSSPKSEFPSKDIGDWKSCSLRYSDTMFLLSTCPSDTEYLLLLLSHLDVPFPYQEQNSTNPLFQSRYKYNYRERSYELHLVKHHMSHQAISSSVDDPLYPFLASKFASQCYNKLRFLLSILVITFIYLVGIRRISVYSSPSSDCTLELTISILFTLIVYFRLG
eukprot:NODE_103_length_20051_cov_0.229401.p10 type:complete len:233 gc:universal NODE_103_length_20051_cov_0.229401:14976-14278(-)